MTECNFCSEKPDDKCWCCGEVADGGCEITPDHAQQRVCLECRDK